MSEILRGPAYRIETERLVLRCWQPTDAPLLKSAVDASLQDLRAFLPWAFDEPQPLDAKVELLRRFRGRFDLGEDFVYGIFDREEKHALGGTGLHTRVGDGAREIGYWIASPHAGRGLATESTAALVRVAFEIERLARVEIHCDPANARSLSIPKKLGFRHEGTLRARTPRRHGEPADRMIWTVLAAEYPETPCARATIRAFDAAGRTILETPPNPRPPRATGRSAFR
jgi:RimJ/RimL family protein N-acetyltransferase